MSGWLKHGVTIAVTLMAALGAKYLVSEYLKPDQLTIHDLEEQLADLGPGQKEIVETLRAEFPETYEAVKARAVQLANDGQSTTAVRKASEQLVTDLRRANADYALTAPDDDLIAVVRMQSDLLKFTQQRSGDEACAAMAIEGAAAMKDPQLMNDFAVQSGENAASLLLALAHGRDTPVDRPPITPSDWPTTIGTFATTDEEAARLTTIGKMDASDPAYCDAIIWFVDGLGAATNEEADRVRAAFVRDVAAG